jgi:methylglyoxal synthase
VGRIQSRTSCRTTYFATGSTGRVLANRLALKVISLESGPLGGDQQIGARVSECTIDMVIFFWDPLEV